MKHREFTFEKGTIGRFIKKHGIRMTLSVTNEVSTPWPWTMKWSLTFTKGDQTFETSFFQSADKEDPEIEEVLATLAHDAILYESVGNDPETYAALTDMDPDDPLLHHSFNEFTDMIRRFRRFLGEEAFEELLTKVYEVHER